MPDDTIINKVISLIAGGSEEEDDDKTVLLKQLAKEIPQNKYAKFYRIRTEEADPSFAQYFHSIYKIVFPARSFLKDTVTMTKIKQVTLESYLDKSTMDTIKRLSPEAVAERKKSVKDDISFSQELQKDLASLTAGFDSPRLAIADKCYNLIGVLNRFASWNYLGMLKKFDPELEDGFTTPPKFAALRVDSIMADISSFLSVLPSFDPGDDWKTVFAILKYCKGGSDLIPLEVWNGLLANLKDLKQSKMLYFMVRLASGNPIWEPKIVPQNDEQLSAVWLSERTGHISRIISGIADNQKNAEIAALEKAVFGAIDTNRLTYYTKEKGRILTEKGIDTFVYAPALNHLAAFTQDFINKEMEELGDILLVRGQWTKNTTSIAMSDAFHTIVDSFPEIPEFDESLADEGPNGSRIRGSLLRVDRDPSQVRYLSNLIDVVNEDALNLIKKIIPSYVVIGKYLKMLMDDCQKKPYELIMNWKELTQVSKIPMVQRLTDDYKKVNYFVQLMILEAQVEVE